MRLPCIRFALLVTLGIGGCSSPLFRAQSPDAEEVAKAPQPETGVMLVKDYARPWNCQDLKVEGVALATQLEGTGSDPPPSMLRDNLIKEMQTHDVKSPARMLASEDTAMILVRGFIPPGAQKGDTFDVEVRVPSRTGTTSLRNGWLMLARLRETQVVDAVLHSGHVMASAQGPILVDALFGVADDEILLRSGRVLSGGIVSIPRQLGLIIREEHSSVRTSSMVGSAISDRFHSYDRGVRAGVANPKRDDMVELAVHARYKGNLYRYLQVISNIAVGEKPEDRPRRLQILERLLLEPTSAQRAASQLEAIGEEAVSTLKKGLGSDDPDVRFYAAEALAYLDDNQAADELYRAARDDRAFRWRALAALSVMDQFAAQERLLELMDEPSAETRYGAFHALRLRNPADPLVRGEILGKEFAFHQVATRGEPMIHFARARRPEVVVFGRGLTMNPPGFLFAGEQILIKAVDERQVKVSRFRPGKETEHLVCSNQVADIVRTIVQLGGGYPDVIMALQAARQKEYLACRIELEALPGEDTDRERARAVASADGSTGSPLDLENPVPDMFRDSLVAHREQVDDEAYAEDTDPPTDDSSKKKGLMARMTSWWTD